MFALIDELLAPYHDGAHYALLGDDIEVSENSRTPLALFFHELATNAAKYGAFSRRTGKLRSRLLIVAMSSDLIGLKPVDRRSSSPKSTASDHGFWCKELKTNSGAAWLTIGKKKGLRLPRMFRKRR